MRLLVAVMGRVDSEPDQQARPAKITARVAALKARDDGHEVVWLAESELAAVVSAAIQEAVDEVWLQADVRQVDAVREAVVRATDSDIEVRRLGDARDVKG